MATAGTQDTGSQRVAKPEGVHMRMAGVTPRWHVACGEAPAAPRETPSSGVGCPGHRTYPNPPCPWLFAAPQLPEVINNQD